MRSWVIISTIVFWVFLNTPYPAIADPLYLSNGIVGIFLTQSLTEL
jgi:hypothetical protein